MNCGGSSLTALTTGESLVAFTCGETGNYTRGSVYNTNLDKLARVLVKSTQGFTTTVVGSIPNMVYGAGLCQGDVKRSD